MPDEAHERLLRVEFLPIRLIHEIKRRPEIMKGLSPRNFERMTAELLSGLGFEDVVLTPRSGDGGRDVVAVQRFRGIPVLFAFECKQYTKKRIQLETLRGLLGTVAHGPTMANIGVLVTTSQFTSGARKFILGEARIDGKDFDDLVQWLGEYRQR
jgi:restriction system protein